MARAGVSYFDVAQAAEALKHRGQNPTVDRVLAHLGTGSKSTLAPLLKRWKGEQGDGTDTGSLPGDVVATVKGLHERLQQGAEEQIRQAEAEYRSRAAELQGQLSEAQHTIRQLQAGQADLQQRLEALQDDNTALRTDNEVERITAAKLETQLDESTDRLGDTKDTIEAQKQELGQVRTHLEHYQNSVAEERQQERAQLQSTQTQWENRLQVLSQQLEAATSRYRTLETAKQQTEANLAQLREVSDQAKQDTQALQLEAARKDEALKQQTSGAAALRKQLATLDAGREAIATELAESKSAHRLLEQEAASLKQQYSEVHDKLNRLTDENRRIAEEKAILTGQLKQIRSDQK